MFFSRTSFCLVLHFNFDRSFWFLWWTVHLFQMNVLFQNLLHFKTEDWNALWGTWHPWHLILGTRMVWVAQRSCCSACCEGSEFEGAKLREGSVLATPFQSPPKESSTACCEYVLAGDNNYRILHFFIYIYIIGFSADDLKKLQHMLIASKYPVILARKCICLSFFVDTCR